MFDNLATNNQVAGLCADNAPLPYNRVNESTRLQGCNKAIYGCYHVKKLAKVGPCNGYTFHGAKFSKKIGVDRTNSQTMKSQNHYPTKITHRVYAHTPSTPFD